VQPCIVTSADLAQTVLNGQSLTSADYPQTQIWFLLYAQLRRADGQAYRNLLLRKLLGRVVDTYRTVGDTGHGTFGGPALAGSSMPSTAGIQQVQSIRVDAAFSQTEVDTLLAELLLPKNTPLSILAVELFNLEDQVIRDLYVGDIPQLQHAGASSGQTGSTTAVATSESVARDQVVRDPLGDELGSQRILRVSPLTRVAPVC
jgi:hypothetical protein